MSQRARKQKAARAFDVVVVGGANYDYSAFSEQLPGPGDTVEGGKIDDAPGGKGANQAVAAARLGARVAFIGRVGKDDRGDRIFAGLQREGIDTTHLRRDPKAPTGVALIHVNAKGEKQILAVGGANRQVTAKDIRAAASIIQRAQVLMLQLEVPLAATMEAARIAHRAGVKIVLDPAPAIPLPEKLLRLLTLIKPNAGEAKTLTKLTVKDRASARRAAKKLLSRGTQAVAITAGTQGNLVVSAEGEWWHPRLPVKSVDATGAGDASAAALAVMLAEGRSLQEAGSFASAAAALTTTIVGAQASLPTRRAVQALARRSDQPRHRA